MAKSSPLIGQDFWSEFLPVHRPLSLVDRPLSCKIAKYSALLKKLCLFWQFQTQNQALIATIRHSQISSHTKKFLETEITHLSLKMMRYMCVIGKFMGTYFYIDGLDALDIHTFTHVFVFNF